MVQQLQEAEVIDFLVSVAGSTSDPEFKIWNSVLMEIFYHLFHGFRVQDLKPELTGNQPSKLHSLLEREKYSKKGSSTRHSRFGGMFSVKSSTGRQVNMSKLPTQAMYAFDAGKTHTKPRKKNLTLELYTERNFLNPSSCTLYHSIASKFLENCFNPLLVTLKRDFDSSAFEKKQEQENGHMQFFFLLAYFLEFYLLNAKEEIELDQITGMMNAPTVFFILKSIHNYKNEKQWKSLYFCVLALEKFMLVLQKMDGFSVEGIKQASLQIQSQIFYEEAYLEMMVSILRDTQPRSRKFLECAINVAETIFQLLESNWNSEEGMMIRKKKALKIAAEGVQDSDDEVSDTPIQGSHERIFSLSKFEYHFANESIIDTYCDLLRDYESLSEQTLENIVKMFNRISDTHRCNKEALFYNVAPANVAVPLLFV
jgi:hypothetical protein